MKRTVVQKSPSGESVICEVDGREVAKVFYPSTQRVESAPRISYPAGWSDTVKGDESGAQRAADLLADSSFTKRAEKAYSNSPFPTFFRSNTPAEMARLIADNYDVMQAYLQAAKERWLGPRSQLSPFDDSIGRFDNPGKDVARWLEIITADPSLLAEWQYISVASSKRGVNRPNLLTVAICQLALWWRESALGAAAGARGVNASTGLGQVTGKFWYDKINPDAAQWSDPSMMGPRQFWPWSWWDKPWAQLTDDQKWQVMMFPCGPNDPSVPSQLGRNQVAISAIVMMSLAMTQKRLPDLVEKASPHADFLKSPVALYCGLDYAYHQGNSGVPSLRSFDWINRYYVKKGDAFVLKSYDIVEVHARSAVFWRCLYDDLAQWGAS